MAHYLSDEELSRTAPAEVASFASPVPTQIVSNGEFNPLPQTRDQQRVEARIKELAVKEFSIDPSGLDPAAPLEQGQAAGPEQRPPPIEVAPGAGPGVVVRGVEEARAPGCEVAAPGVGRMQRRRRGERRAERRLIQAVRGARRVGAGRTGERRREQDGDHIGQRSHAGPPETLPLICRRDARAPGGPRDEVAPTGAPPAEPVISVRLSLMPPRRR